MKYKFAYVSARTFGEALRALEKDIEDYMEQGYVPQGGVSVVEGSLYCYVAQGMIKKE